MSDAHSNLARLLVSATSLISSSCADEASNPTDVGTQPEQPSEKISALVEKLPGSRNLSPDGTWWSYNMTKVVRHGDFVFTYVIENDGNPSHASQTLASTRARLLEQSDVYVDAPGRVHILPNWRKLSRRRELLREDHEGGPDVLSGGIDETVRNSRVRRRDLDDARMRWWE